MEREECGRKEIIVLTMRRFSLGKTKGVYIYNKNVKPKYRGCG